MGAFEFVVVSSLRAAQLQRGCRPRVDGAHKATVTAQFEVAERKVTRVPDAPVVIVDPIESGHPLVDDVPILVQQT
jgi:DNA-directed RNA polymerase subunit K/omega